MTVTHKLFHLSLWNENGHNKLFHLSLWSENGHNKLFYLSLWGENGHNKLFLEFHRSWYKTQTKLHVTVNSMIRPVHMVYQFINQRI